MIKNHLDQNFLNFNKVGLIPGPEEKEEDFILRAHYCLNLKTDIAHSLQEQIPFSIQDQLSSDLLIPGCKKVDTLYDFNPEWIPLFFSDHQLAPWHGGCAWIFQADEKSPTGAFLQLRQALLKKRHYLGLYERDELIAHELVHVGRMAFDEPKFEEVLAYRTSTSSFRKWVGPIIESSYESMFFVIALMIIFLIDFSLIATGNHSAYQLAMWIKLIPLGLIMLALARLWNKQHRFSKCLKNLTDLLKDEHKAGAVIFRLRDKEISAFAKMTGEQILHFAREQSELRWKVIFQAYFIAM